MFSKLSYCFIALLSFALCKCRSAEPHDSDHQLLSLFERKDGDTIRIYADASGGKRISPGDYSLFKFPEGLPVDTNHFTCTAMNTFAVDETHDAYTLRFEVPMVETSVYLYLFDKEKKIFSDPFQVAYGLNSGEDADFRTYSVVTDIDKDEVRDVLTRVHECNRGDGPAPAHFVDTLLVRKIKDGKPMLDKVSNYEELKSKVVLTYSDCL